MSATTTPTTFIDLVNDLLNRARGQDGTSGASTNTTNYAKRYINDANQDVHTGQNWPWAERRAYLQTHAPYTTGTVSIALTARTTVTGASTLWNTAVTGMGFNNARAGGKMTFAGGTDVYTVSTVGSDTAITLADRYLGDTALSGATYSYIEDEYALESDFWRLVDIREFSQDWPLPVISRQEFYRRYPRNILTGKPRTCTIIDLAPSGNTTPRPRVILHPVPDASYNIPYRYITTNLAVSTAGAGAANLVADDDEPIIPLRYRRILVLHALVQWYRDRKDDQRSQEASAEYVDLWKRMANDTIAERDRPRVVHSRARYLAMTAGPRRSARRYQTGTEFDELRV